MQRAGSAEALAHSCTVLVGDTRAWRPEHASLLDATECSRAEVLTPVANRARFMAGAALLRLALARELDVAPRDVTIDRTCRQCHRPHGKPRAPGSGLHVSVSHAETMVLVALTSAAAVGVDVEARRRHLVPGLGRIILAPSEEVSLPDALLRYWCRKESVVKATGDGLRVPLRDVVTSRIGSAPRLLSYQGRQMRATVVDLSLGPDFVGALTVLTDEAVAVTVTSAATLLGSGSLPPLDGMPLVE